MLRAKIVAINDATRDLTENLKKLKEKVARLRIASPSLYSQSEANYRNIDFMSVKSAETHEGGASPEFQNSTRKQL